MYFSSLNNQLLASTFKQFS